MRLDEFWFPPGARKKRKRVGRGRSSGHGKTCGRGHKGQKSRRGESIRPGYEGGQMPLYRRVPKYGFSNAPFKKEYEIVNVGRLAEVFEDGAEVGPEQMRERRLIRRRDCLVKVLGDGRIDKKLKVRAHKFSKTAASSIEAAGGTVEVI